MNGPLLFIAGGAAAILLAAARSHDPRHISSATLPQHTSQGINHPMLGVEPDGICHCDPQPESSALGECPQCHRLDPRKAYA